MNLMGLGFSSSSFHEIITFNSSSFFNPVSSLTLRSMAPNGETIISSYTRNETKSNKKNKNGKFMSKPPRLSMESLQRTTSDISFQLSKAMEDINTNLPPISEVEDAKCECCGMSEECTPQYIQRVRDKFSGKLICGLCSEAVKEEMEKNGGKIEEALNSHMSVCVKFNRLGRAYPALYQADAMREILKKSTSKLDGLRIRSKSSSPRERVVVVDVKKGGGLMRTSSCIPAITRDINDRKTTVASSTD